MSETDFDHWTQSNLVFSWTFFLFSPYVYFPCWFCNLISVKFLNSTNNINLKSSKLQHYKRSHCSYFFENESSITSPMVRLNMQWKIRDQIEKDSCITNYVISSPVFFLVAISLGAHRSVYPKESWTKLCVPPYIGIFVSLHKKGLYLSKQEILFSCCEIGWVYCIYTYTRKVNRKLRVWQLLAYLRHLDVVWKAKNVILLIEKRILNAWVLQWENC